MRSWLSGRRGDRLLNSQTEAIFGYTRQELVGRPVETLIPERFRSDHQDHLHVISPKRWRGRWGWGGTCLAAQRRQRSSVEMRLEPIETSEGTVIWPPLLTSQKEEKPSANR